MSTLILDQFSQQSLFKRIFSYVFTSMGWGFWICLWLPLLEAMLILLTHHEASREATAALSSLAGLIDTLSTHMTAIAGVLAAFLFWAILQSLGKKSRLQAIEKQGMAMPYKTLPYLKQWQTAQCMLVSHDEITGSIKRVRILNNKGNEIERAAFMSTCLNIHKHHRDAIR